MLGQSTSLDRLGHVFWLCVTRQLLLAVGAGCMEQDDGWTVQKLAKSVLLTGTPVYRGPPNIKNNPQTAHLQEM